MITISPTELGTLCSDVMLNLARQKFGDQPLHRVRSQLAEMATCLEQGLTADHGFAPEDANAVANDFFARALDAWNHDAIAELVYGEAQGSA